MSSKPRNPVFDRMRGIGIVLVVLGHSGFAASSFIYLFHMPLFFMLSGWFFDPQRTGDASGLRRFALSRIKALWLPFVAANTLFTLCNNLFLRLHILSDDPRLLEIPGNTLHQAISWKDILGRTLHWCVFDGGTQLGGALWFLQVLLVISLAYACVHVLLYRFLAPAQALAAHTVLAALLLVAGWLCQRGGFNPWLFGTICSSYLLFHLGVMLRHFHRLPDRTLPRAACALLCGAALLGLDCLGGVGLAANEYTGPLFLLVCSLLGWYLVYSVAALLPAAALALPGRHSRAVLILHLLCFKVVTFAGLLADGGVDYRLAAFPVYFTGGLWWAGYTAAGLLIPLGLALLWKRLASRRCAAS